MQMTELEVYVACSHGYHGEAVPVVQKKLMVVAWSMHIIYKIHVFVYQEYQAVKNSNRINSSEMWIGRGTPKVYGSPTYYSA